MNYGEGKSVFTLSLQTTDQRERLPKEASQKEDVRTSAIGVHIDFHL